MLELDRFFLQSNDPQYSCHLYTLHIVLAVESYFVSSSYSLFALFDGVSGKLGFPVDAVLFSLLDLITSRTTTTIAARISNIVSIYISFGAVDLFVAFATSCKPSWY